MTKQEVVDELLVELRGCLCQALDFPRLLSALRESCGEFARRNPGPEAAMYGELVMKLESLAQADAADLFVSAALGPAAHAGRSAR